MKNVQGPQQGDFQQCLGGNMTTSMYFGKQPHREAKIQNRSCRSFPHITINKWGTVDEYKHEIYPLSNKDEMFTKFRKSVHGI